MYDRVAPQSTAQRRSRRFEQRPEDKFDEHMPVQQNVLNGTINCPIPIYDVSTRIVPLPHYVPRVPLKLPVKRAPIKVPAQRPIWIPESITCPINIINRRPYSRRRDGELAELAYEQEAEVNNDFEMPEMFTEIRPRSPIIGQV